MQKKGCHFQLVNINIIIAPKPNRFLVNETLEFKAKEGTMTWVGRMYGQKIPQYHPSTKTLERIQIILAAGVDGNDEIFLQK